MTLLLSPQPPLSGNKTSFTAKSHFPLTISLNSKCVFIRFIKNTIALFFLIYSIFLYSICVSAKEIGEFTKLPVPRFVTLKSNSVNLRAGPDFKYPLKATCRCKGMPVEIIEEFEHWRKIRTFEGLEAWTHENLLSGHRSVIIKSSNGEIYKNEQIPASQAVLFRLPDDLSYPVFKIELGTIAKIKKCKYNWCNISVDRSSGWIKIANLWGVYEDEFQ